MNNTVSLSVCMYVCLSVCLTLLSMSDVGSNSYSSGENFHHFSSLVRFLLGIKPVIHYNVLYYLNQDNKS